MKARCPNTVRASSWALGDQSTSEQWTPQILDQPMLFNQGTPRHWTPWIPKATWAPSRASYHLRCIQWMYIWVIKASHQLDIQGESYLGCLDNTWPMGLKSKANPIQGCLDSTQPMDLLQLGVHPGHRYPSAMAKSISLLVSRANPIINSLDANSMSYPWHIPDWTPGLHMLGTEEMPKPIQVPAQCSIRCQRVDG